MGRSALGIAPPAPCHIKKELSNKQARFPCPEGLRWVSRYASGLILHASRLRVLERCATLLLQVNVDLDPHEVRLFPSPMQLAVNTDESSKACDGAGHG